MSKLPEPHGEDYGQPRGMLNRVSYWVTPANALLFATFLLEGLWVYVWMVWLGHWGALGWAEVPLTPLSILCLLWISYQSVQILGEQSWSEKKARIVTGVFATTLLALVARLENGGGYGLLDWHWVAFAGRGLVGSFPTALQATFLVGAYLWWRGYRLARQGIHQEQVFHSFAVGLGGTILGLLAWEMASRSGADFVATGAHSMLITFAFFFTAFSALSLSHVLHVRTDIVRQEGDAESLGSHWSPMVLGVAAGMVVLGWIAAVLFPFDLWSPFFWMLSLARNLLLFLLYYLLMPLALVGAALVYIIQWVLHALGVGSGDRINVRPALRPFQMPEDYPVDTGVPLWTVLLQWGLLLLVAGLAVYFLSRMLLKRRSKGGTDSAVVELHESVGSWNEFARDVLLGMFQLVSWFRDRGQHLRRKVRLPARLKYMDPDQEMDVRELYGRLLEEARLAGFPKEDRETPFEYLASLERHLPTDKDALDRITQDYVAVRYGEQTVSQEEKSLLNVLWRSVYDRIRERSREGESSSR